MQREIQILRQNFKTQKKVQHILLKQSQ